MKILLVEDDKTLNELTAKALKRMNYTVEQSFNGEEAWELYQLNKYDIIVLDLNLPFISGIELLKKIRLIDKDIRILILSARRSIEDKLLGFNNGATDYLTKPFDILELEVRIANLLRWEFTQSKSKVEFGRLSLDRSNKEVFFQSKKIDLTRKEYGILEQLFINTDTFLPAETIIEKVWENDEALFSNTFKFHIYSLRKKIDEVTKKEIYIVNKRGFGYKLKLSNDNI